MSTAADDGALPPLRQHDHACWSYATDQERSAVLGDYFAAGLAARERLLYFGRDAADVAPLSGLIRLGHDVDELLASGALILADAEQAYFPDGRFDAEANLEGFKQLSHLALIEGYLGIRVAAENAGVLNHRLVRDTWFDYELQVDALVAAEPIVGLCCFDRRQCDQEALELIDAVHLRHLEPFSDAPHSGFHLHTPREDVLALTGEIDRFAVDGLKRLLHGTAQRRESLRIDLRGLTFIDAAGMRALEDLAAARPGGFAPLEVEGVTGFQRKAWDATGGPKGLSLVSS